ncbi:MAG: hypothetical protein E6G97_01805 [Alphaproteobacteria bacterium]|nr:MAG: hypothetical protein E6G97_01805 [Alphaproteobacteria bacterium]
MFDVRRAVFRVLAPACVGAAVAALAAAHALAQPATRPGTSLGPAFEDTEDLPLRGVPARNARRRDTRPAGDLPNFDNAEANPPASFGNPPGFGAAGTGFVSTNKKRRPAQRKGVRTQATQGAMQRAPLALKPPGSGATAGLPTATSATAPASAPTNATPAAAPPALPPPRNLLVRIPDGTPTGGVAGTVSTAQMSAAHATLLRRRTAAEEDAFAQLGLRAGAFLVLPAVEVLGGYDTNPARTATGRPSAFVTVSPELLAKSDWQRHEVTVALRGSYTAYGQTPELDRPSADNKITGRLDVTRDTALIGEGTLVVGTDNPGSPNVQAGLSRFPIFTTFGSSAGIQQRFNRIEVTAKGTVERTQFQDSVFTDGTTESNADRDFNRYAALMRTSYDLMPGIKPFVEASYDTRIHDQQIDRFGLQRDSTGWSVKGGSTFAFWRILTGEIAVGYLERNYKDPSLLPLQGFLFDASLIYSLSALTSIKLTAATVAGETTVPGTAGILTRNAGIEVEHAFRRWLIGAVKFNYGNDDYVGSTRKDDRFAIAGTITYKMNRLMQVKAELRQEWLRSTTPGADYAATVFMLGMRLQR